MLGADEAEIPAQLGGEAAEIPQQSAVEIGLGMLGGQAEEFEGLDVFEDIGGFRMQFLQNWRSFNGIKNRAFETGGITPRPQLGEKHQLLDAE